MKLHYLHIENFRAIAQISIDFTDYLSRPQPVNLIVGPNGSGKTSILDAIHLAIKSFENPQNPDLREGLQYNPQQLVRGRGKQAKIELEFSVETEEAKAINQVYSSLGLEQNFDLSQGEVPPLNNPAKVSWIFPNPDTAKPGLFSYEYEPENAVRVLGARGAASLAVKQGYVGSEIMEKIGGICYLDERRSMRLQNSWEYLLNGDRHFKDRSDIFWLLYHYCLQDFCWNREKYGESPWQRIQRLFNEICHPTELVGLESGPGIDTLIFRRNGVEYDFMQMSAGESQVLIILVTLAVETAKNSLVIVDGVELYLNSTWQERLIDALREDDANNQYIFTTHSPAVMSLFYDSEITLLKSWEKK